MLKAETRKLYVGIDVHSREHKVAILPSALLEQRPEVWRTAKFLNIRNNARDYARLDEAIKSEVDTVDQAAIIIDSTGGHYSEPLLYFLQSKGYSVHYLESKAVKAARQRLLDQDSKSDLIDSVSFALLLYLRDCHGVSFRVSATAPELNSRAATLKSLMLQKWQYSKLGTQATNRLHQYLLAVFPEAEAQYFSQLIKITHRYPTPRDILRGRGLKTVKNLSEEHKAAILELANDTVGVPGDTYRWLIRDLSLQRIEYSRKQEEIMSVVRDDLKSHPYTNILLSFPGLAEIGAATLIGIIQDVARFPTKKKFRKALGVYARWTQSGNSPGHSYAGKEGNREGRRILFLACLVCIKTCTRENDFKDYYLRQLALGKARMKALVATMGKLAEIIYHCLNAGEAYQYKGTYKVRIK